MSERRSDAQRERLAPILAQLDATEKAGEGSVFLDLCELVLMLSERIEGSIKWEHPRVTLYIKQRAAAERARAKREKGEGK